MLVYFLDDVNTGSGQALAGAVLIAAAYCALVRWTCWNTIFLIFCIQAHNVRPFWKEGARLHAPCLPGCSAPASGCIHACLLWQQQPASLAGAARATSIMHAACMAG